jgi:hypothetical protein
MVLYRVAIISRPKKTQQVTAGLKSALFTRLQCMAAMRGALCAGEHSVQKIDTTSRRKKTRTRA